MLTPAFEDGMPFDVGSVQERLAGGRIGFRIRYDPLVDSTNRVAAALARRGAPEGTVVLADGQTAGRGRLQRSWQSPPGCNLYLSVILRPAIPPRDVPQITLLAGVAVAEAVSVVFAGRIGIKWPNDLLIGGRKVCGILAETRICRQRVDSVVVGIGLNVNIERADFDPAYRQSATSLREETGRIQSREELLFLICERLGKWYGTFLRDGFDPVREGWLAGAEMAGKSLRIRFGDQLQQGLFAGIDRDGALLLADPRGAVMRIMAGDATILKE